MAKYFAFLSYRSSDRRQAEWLHKKLEAYRVPRRLVGMPGSHGAVPERVRPVFLDRNDARTEADIHGALAGYIRDSRHLIVLCSPAAAAQDSWVADEIEIFRALEPRRTLHAVIGSGPVPECFPAPLRVASADGRVQTPLAADLRPRSAGGDGTRRGFVKLVAGLIGCGFDELWRRERRRLLLFWAVAAGVVAFGSSALTMMGADTLAVSLAGAAQRRNDGQQFDSAMRLGVRAARLCMLPSSCVLARLALARAAAGRIEPKVYAPPPDSNGWPGMNDARFDADGRRFVTASNDRFVRVWDLRSGNQLCAPLEHPDSVESVRFSRDGKELLTVSRDLTGAINGVFNASFAASNAAHLWDLETCSKRVPPMTHGDRIANAEYSPEQSRVLTASSDHTARLWDARNGRSMGSVMQHADQVRSAHFSADGRRVVTASFDKTVRVWDGETGQPLGTPFDASAAAWEAVFSPDGSRIAYTAANAAVLVRADGSERVTLTHDRPVIGVVFSSDGRWIATRSEDRTARVWDARSGMPVSAPMQLGNQPAAVSFSLDGSRLVTVGHDEPAAVTSPPTVLPENRKVRVWDAQSGLMLAELVHPEDVASASFSPDGRLLVTASEDSKARVWDVAWSSVARSPALAGEVCARAISGSRRLSELDLFDAGLLASLARTEDVCWP